MPDHLFSADHPARDIPALAETVRSLDDFFDPGSGVPYKGSPAIATHVALTAAYRGYTAGRADAIRELKTTDAVAVELGVTPLRVRQLAKARGVGWQLSRGTWLFQPSDIDALRVRVAGRPKRST